MSTRDCASIEKRSRPPIFIPDEARAPAGLAFIRRLRKEGCQVLALSVSAGHLHAQTEMPDDLPAIRRIVGRAKSEATLAMAPALTGNVWSEGGEFKRVREKSHQQNAYEYILTKQGPDAWTWSYRDEAGLPRFPEGWEQLKRRRRGTRGR